jgi:hypothetical protein
MKIVAAIFSFIPDAHFKLGRRLGSIRHGKTHFTSHSIERRHPTTGFVMVMAGTTLLAASLHAMEPSI